MRRYNGFFWKRLSLLFFTLATMIKKVEYLLNKYVLFTLP